MKLCRSASGNCGQWRRRDDPSQRTKSHVTTLHNRQRRKPKFPQETRYVGRKVRHNGGSRFVSRGSCYTFCPGGMFCASLRLCEASVWYVPTDRASAGLRICLPADLQICLPTRLWVCIRSASLPRLSPICIPDIPPLRIRVVRAALSALPTIRICLRCIHAI
jgi:hypothetical protein